MTDLDDSKLLARALRSAWGRRARATRLDVSRRGASAVIYDAATVALSTTSDGIRIDVGSAVRPLPVLDRSSLVNMQDLPASLSEIDSEVRSTLPVRFLRRLDEWASSGGQTISLESHNRTPGPPLRSEQIAHEIHSFWKSDVSAIHSTPGHPLLVEALIYFAIQISISIESQHGGLIGGILVGDDYQVSAFGRWLSADHPDTTGLQEVCSRIDEWARLRLDLPTPETTLSAADLHE